MLRKWKWNHNEVGEGNAATSRGERKVGGEEECGRGACNTHPSVVMVTNVYQNAEGMDVKVVSSTFFSA